TARASPAAGYARIRETDRFSPAYGFHHRDRDPCFVRASAGRRPPPASTPEFATRYRLGIPDRIPDGTAAFQLRARSRPIRPRRRPGGLLRGGVRKQRELYFGPSQELSFRFRWNLRRLTSKRKM